MSLGSLFAGITLSKVSGSLTFRYFGFGALGACFIHISAQYLLRRKGNESPETRVSEQAKKIEKS